VATERALEGRVAVVTGAARGIGRGIAVELAKAGADVAIGDLVDRPEIAKDAEQTAAAVEALGRRALVVACDVTDPAGPEALVAAALGELGGLDCVVANAGVLGAVPVAEMDPAEWERVLSVNATGTFHTCRAALPHLIERGRGAIVNVSSTAGLRGAATRAHYSASKFAVIGFSQSLALEVAKSGIRVNCVAPASVRSAMTVSELMAVTGLEDPEQADALWTEVAAKRLPFGRSVEPEDIGRAVVFLCAAEMISGVVLPVTGGEDLRR
jgi:meso-butanediol dehydrogenase/(S,S)-butanediol dehydrogenase/diacetyl reductase